MTVSSPGSLRPLRRQAVSHLSLCTDVDRNINMTLREAYPMKKKSPGIIIIIILFISTITPASPSPAEKSVKNPDTSKKEEQVKKTSDTGTTDTGKNSSDSVNTVNPPEKKTGDTSGTKTRKDSTPGENKDTPVTEKKDETVKKPGKSDEEKLQLEEKKVQWILETLDFGIQKDRIDAINRVQLIKNSGLRKKCTDRVIKMLEEETDSELCVKAISALSEMKVREALSVIMKKLKDVSEDVMVAAIYAIKDLNGIEAVDILIEKLKACDLAKNSNLTEALIIALGDMKAVKIIPFTTEALKNSRTTRINRENLVLFLGKLESKEPAGILTTIFNDEEEETTLRSYAVNSLAKLQITEAIQDIKKLIKAVDSYPFKKKKKYYTLYMYSVAALIRMGDNDSYPLLINALRSDNALVRLKAVKLIGELKDKRTIDILKYKIKYDPNSKVKKAAEDALKEIEKDSALKETEKKAPPVDTVKDKEKTSNPPVIKNEMKDTTNDSNEKTPVEPPGKKDMKPGNPDVQK